MGPFGDHLVSAHHPLSKYDGGLQWAYISDDELTQADPIVFRAKQIGSIMALRERTRVHIHLSRSFCMEDLVWADHVTSGKRKYKILMAAILFWDRLDDFIKREQ